ncbi:MAG: hypothetical protein R3F46_02095 [bacterium]
MPAGQRQRVEGGALCFEYGPLPQLGELADHAALVEQLRAPLCILQQGETLYESGPDFPLLEFALDFASWCCPHAFWLFELHPRLRDEMEHLPGGLGSADFAAVDSVGELLLGIQAEGPLLLLPDPQADNGLRSIALRTETTLLRELGQRLLSTLAADLATQSGWDIAPLVRRRWRMALLDKPRRGPAPALDVATRLAWEKRLLHVDQAGWQLSFSLAEPGRDVASLEELPGVVSGSLSLRGPSGKLLQLEDFPLLEFALTALDWLSDAGHASLRLRRGSTEPQWGGYELGSAADGNLLVALRRRSGGVEILGPGQRARGSQLPEQQLGRLLLEFAAELLRELHARTGWSALPLFGKAHGHVTETHPALLPDFELLPLMLERPGSRSLAGREKSLPLPATPLTDLAPEVLLEGPARGLELPEPPMASALSLELRLLDLPQRPQTPADLQEALRCSVQLRRGSRLAIADEEGLPLLDFCLNCLVWLCRHESVSPAASRERDPRRRGRPVDFILAYPQQGGLQLGLREDPHGYLLLLERPGRPVASLLLSHSEAWMLMFDIAAALVQGVHARWGWDIRPLFGARSYHFSERPLQLVPSIGYMNLERDVRELSDWRHGITRGPAGCLRI